MIALLEISIWTFNHQANHLNNVLERYHLHQIIQKPSRCTKDSKNLIHHMSVRSVNMSQESRVVQYSLSNHCLVCLTWQEKVLIRKLLILQISYRNFKKFSLKFLNYWSNVPFFYGINTSLEKLNKTNFGLFKGTILQ